MQGYSPTSFASRGDSPKLRMAVVFVSSKRQGIFATSAPRSREPLLQMPGWKAGGWTRGWMVWPHKNVKNLGKKWRNLRETCGFLKSGESGLVPWPIKMCVFVPWNMVGFLECFWALKVPEDLAKMEKLGQIWFVNPPRLFKSWLMALKLGWHLPFHNNFTWLGQFQSTVVFKWGRGLKHHPLIIRKLEDVAYLPSLFIGFLVAVFRDSTSRQHSLCKLEKMPEGTRTLFRASSQRWPNKYSQTNFNEVDIRISWHMHIYVSVGSSAMTCCSFVFTISLPPLSQVSGLIPTGTSAHLILAHTGAGIQLRPILQEPQCEAAARNTWSRSELHGTCRVPLQKHAGFHRKFLHFSSLLGGWPGMTL